MAMHVLQKVRAWKFLMKSEPNESSAQAQLQPSMRRNDDGDDGGGDGNGGGSGVGGGGGGGNMGGGTTRPDSPMLAVNRLAWGDFSYRIQLDCYTNSSDEVVCPVDEQDNTLPDGDHIWLKEENGLGFGISTSEVEIVLKSASNVTWWKEIKAFDLQGATLGWVQTQDGAHGPVSMRFDAQAVDSIVFGKAKAFGVHTGMYQVIDLWSKRGNRLTFEWRSD